MELGGRIALVTGAASGIGAASARRFAAEGATVVAADIDAEGLATLAAELGVPHRAFELDVRDRGSWSALAARIATELGGLDVAFLNAGVMTRPRGAPVLDDPLASIDRFELVVDVNLKGTIAGVIAVLPLLANRGGGRIVITASGAGINPFAADPVYGATKAGLIALVRALAPTLEPRGVAIDSICPFSIDTPMVPVDLRAARVAAGGGGGFAPPDYLADCVVRVLAAEGSGGTWIARQDGEAPFRFDFGEVDRPAAARTGYSA